MNQSPVTCVQYCWDFDCPADAIWAVLADTARFNEAAGFPKHTIEELPQADGSVRFVARARVGGWRIAWDDRPQNWVDNRWFEHRRDFHNGPIASLDARFEVTATAAGSRGVYIVELTPANVLGRLLLRLGLTRLIRRRFDKLAAAARDFCRGARATEFDFPAPKLVAGAARRAGALAQRIERSPFGHGLGRRLADYVLTRSDADVWSLRPLKLARRWQVPPRAAIEVCLEAVKEGLLALRWDLLCPRCRIGKQSVAALKNLPGGAHCASCNIDFKREFSANVELAFYPSASIRAVDEGVYCMAGPMSTPHIKLQRTVPAGGALSETIDLGPGTYRIRTLQPGAAEIVEFERGPFPRLTVAEDGRIEMALPGVTGAVSLANRTGRNLTLVIEELAWRRDALTADRVTTLQAFRDLFNDQVLRPGDDVEIDSITIMFTDLKASTALYNRIGDPAAYVLVREHFEILGRAVRETNGSIVKMIGDAIMAVFADPVDGLRCARRIHADIDAFNATSDAVPLTVKLGLHTGRCISVTINDRLDYYGAVANMAARLQGQSQGGDIVMSREFARDPAVAPRLEPFALEEQQVHLKGFDQPAPYYRLDATQVQAWRIGNEAEGFAGEAAAVTVAST